MKKAFIGLMAVMAMVSCAKEVKVSSVDVTPSELTLVVGGKKLLEAKASPAEAIITSETEWTSSDKSVATVAPTGLVTAIAPGTATITATINGIAGTCALTVSDTELTGISFKGGTTTTKVTSSSEKVTLEAVITPEKATNKNVTWASSDDEIATVTPVGGSPLQAVVEFVGSGSVEITATTEVGGLVATQKYAVLGDQPLYVLPEGTVYAGVPAAYSLNTTAYPTISNATWTVDGVEYHGDPAEFAVDVNQSLEDATDGLAMPTKTTVSLKAEIDGTEVQTDFEVTVEPFWIVQETELWGRNCTPLFNKECTKAYVMTRNNDDVATGRTLLQLDLVTKEVKNFNLAPDNEISNNGGQFCVNPLNGDVICNNCHQVICVTESMTQKWVCDIPGLSVTSGGAFGVTGCGPVLINDCSVAIVPTQTGVLYAIDTETGEILDSVTFAADVDCMDATLKYTKKLEYAQLCVVKENYIILHRNSNSKSIHYLNYDKENKKLTLLKEANSVTGSLTDITSPTVNKSQTYAYFGGNSTICRLDINKMHNTLSDTDHLTGGATGTGLQCSGCICDGYYFYGTSVSSGISRVDLTAPTSESGYVANVLENRANNLRNYDAVAAGEDKNVYFAYKENKVAVRLCKMTVNEDGEADVKVLGSCPIGGDWYQASFNMGGNYLVICCRDENKKCWIYARALTTKRAKGWSGFGGDVCGTKNANIAWAE